MSIHARKRKVAATQFMITAIKIWKYMMIALMKDFGTKKHIKDIAFYTSMLSDEDKAELKRIEQECAKLDKDESQNLKIITSFPKWTIKYFRKNILNHLRVMLVTVRLAYSLFPTNKAEYELKIGYLNKCIGVLESLIQEITLLIEVFNINPNKWTRLVSDVEYEIKLIRGLIKSCRKKLKEFDNQNDDNEVGDVL